MSPVADCAAGQWSSSKPAGGGRGRAAFCRRLLGGWDEDGGATSTELRELCSLRHANADTRRMMQKNNAAADWSQGPRFCPSAGLLPIASAAAQHIMDGRRRFRRMCPSLGISSLDSGRLRVALFLAARKLRAFRRPWSATGERLSPETGPYLFEQTRQVDGLGVEIRATDLDALGAIA